MTILRVYDFGMARHVWVQIAGVEKAVRIEADKIEVDQGTEKTVLKRNDKQVAEFQRGAVVGWWIQDD